MTDSQIESKNENAFRFNLDTVNSLGSFDDAIKLSESTHEEPAAVASGIRVMRAQDKQRYIGARMILLEWRFLFSEENDKEYVSVLLVAENKDGTLSKWFLNDGSTGIFQELREYTQNTGMTGNVVCPGGLRVSDYKIDPDTKKPLTREQVAQYKRQNRPMDDASTWYLDVK